MKRLVMLALFAAACGPTVLVDGHKLDQRLYDTAVAKVKDRAKFDFDCPAEKLQTTVIATWPSSDSEVQQLGVRGCDHHGTYVDTGSAWVLNSHDTPASAR